MSIELRVVAECTGILRTLICVPHACSACMHVRGPQACSACMRSMYHMHAVPVCSPCTTCMQCLYARLCTTFIQCLYAVRVPHACSACMHVCVPHACIASRCQKRVSDSLAGIIEGCEPPCGYCELNQFLKL